MTDNLNDVRTKLYQAFDKALSLADSSMENGDNHQKASARARALSAAAKTAQALTGVEHEIAVLALLDEARKRGDQITLDMDKGLLRAITPLNPIKLKTPGEKP